MSTSKENNKALDKLSTKLLETMNDRGIKHPICYLF